MVLPTVEVPPDSFGSPGDMGILKRKSVVGNMLLYDPPTDIPQKGGIVLSYLTKSEPDEPVDTSGLVGCVQLDNTPYN
jgi:hypothetical protein